MASFVIGDYEYTSINPYTNPQAVRVRVKASSQHTITDTEGFPKEGTVEYNNVTYYITSMEECFAETDLVSAEFPYLQLQYVTNMDRCFYKCRQLEKALINPILPNTTVKTLTECFSGNHKLRFVDIHDMKAVTTISQCFFDCKQLETADVSGMDSLLYMQACFNNCRKLSGFIVLDCFPEYNEVARAIDDRTGIESTALSFVVPDSMLTTWQEALQGNDNVHALSYNLVQEFSDFSLNGYVYAGTLKRTYVQKPNSQSYDYVTQIDTLSATAESSAEENYPLVDMNVTDLSSCFRDCTMLQDIPENMKHLPHVHSLQDCFKGCYRLESADLSGMRKVTDLSRCFSNCSDLESVDLSDMPKVAYMIGTFAGCLSLESAPDLSGMTSLMNMANCFMSCTSLKFADLSELPTIVYMNGCFTYCASLEWASLAIDSTDDPGMYYLDGCFYGCSSLVTVDITGHTTINKMGNCFTSCRKLKGFLQIDAIIDFTSQDNEQILPMESDDTLILLPPYSQLSDWSSTPKSSKITVAPVPSQQAVMGWSYTIGEYSYFLEISSSGSGSYTVTRLSAIAILYVPGMINPVYKRTYEPVDMHVKDLTAGYGNTYILKVPEQIRHLRHVTKMTRCFASCTSLTSADLSGMTSVTNISNCFKDCTSLTSADLSGMTSVTDISNCFENCRALQDVDLSGMTSTIFMAQCFARCQSLSSIPDLSSMSRVRDLVGCFNSCTSLTSADLSGMSSVNDISSCFHSCTALTSADLSGMASVTIMEHCFQGCTSLTSADLSGMTSLTNMQYGFYGCSALPSIDLSGMTSVRLMLQCFYDCISLVSADLSGMTSVTNLSSCFHNCTALVSANLTGMASVTNMRSCFNTCNSLETVSGISGMASLSVIAACFMNCISLRAIPDLTGASSITEMGSCFYNCTSLTSADLSGMSSVTDMGSCFALCTALISADLSGMSSVTDMSTCFHSCSSLSSVNLSGMGAVTNLTQCFQNCTSLVGDLVVSCKPTDWMQMFYNTVQDIWIVPTEDWTGYQDTVGDVWWTIYQSCPSNIHFNSLNKNPKPTCTIDCIRTETELDFEENLTGTVLFVSVKGLTPYSTYSKTPVSLAKVYVAVTDQDVYYTVDDLSDFGTNGYGEEVIYTSSVDMPATAADLTFVDNAGDVTTMTQPYGDIYAILVSTMNNRKVHVVVEDSLGKRNYFYVSVPKSFATFSFLKPGTGLGIGVPATRSGLDVDFKSYFSENMAVADHLAIPVVISYQSQPSQDADYPNPCIVLCVDPGYLMGQLVPGYSPSSTFGIRPFLVGSDLQSVASSYRTSMPCFEDPSAWLPALANDRTEARFFPNAGSDGILTVGLFGFDSYTIALRNGKDRQTNSTGMSFHIYGIDVEDIAHASPVATTADLPVGSRGMVEYTFQGLESKSHFFKVLAVEDAAYDASEYEAMVGPIEVDSSYFPQQLPNEI